MPAIMFVSFIVNCNNCLFVRSTTTKSLYCLAGQTNPFALPTPFPAPAPAASALDSPFGGPGVLVSGALPAPASNPFFGGPGAGAAAGTRPLQPAWPATATSAASPFGGLSGASTVAQFGQQPSQAVPIAGRAAFSPQVFGSSPVQLQAPFGSPGQQQAMMAGFAALAQQPSAFGGSALPNMGSAFGAPPQPASAASPAWPSAPLQAQSTASNDPWGGPPPAQRQVFG